MANEERTAQITLKLKIDPADLNRALQGQEVIRKSLNRMAIEAQIGEKELAKLRTAMKGLKGDELDRARLLAAKFEEQIAKTRAQAQKLVSTLNEKPTGLLQAYQQAKAAADTPAGGGAGFVGGRGSRLAVLGTELRALPAVGTPLGVSTDVFAKILNIFGRLSPAVGAAGIALGVFIGVLALIAENERKLEEATRKRIQAEQEIRRVISEATTEELKIKAEAAKKSVELFQAEVQRLTIERRQLLNSAGFLDTEEMGTFDQFRKNAHLAFGDLKGVEEELAAAIENANKYGLELNGLNTALLENAAAANDAAEAEKRLTEARQANARANIDRLISVEQEVNQLRTTGTSDQLEARLNSLEIEKKAILDNLQAAQKLADETGDTSQLDRLRARLADIDTLVMSIQTQDIAGIIQAREDEKQRIDDLKKSTEELEKAAESAANAQADYVEKLEDIAANVLKRLADAAADRDKALNKAFADAEADRAKIIGDVQDNLNEAEQKALEDREKEQREHQKRLQKIIRDSGRDIQTAIEDRDAVAKARAEQAQQDALDDEDSAYKDRLTDIDKALAKENQQINKRYLEQLRAVDDRLRQQTQDVIMRYNEQVQAAYIYGNEARAVAKRALDRQLQDLQAALTVEKQYRDGAHRAMMQGAKVYADYLLAVAAVLRNASQGARTTGGGGRSRPTPYARGLDAGLAPAFKDILVGEREPEILRLPTRGAVFTMGQYKRAGAGGVTVMPGGVVINGSRLNEAQLEKAVTRGLERFAKAVA